MMIKKRVVLIRLQWYLYVTCITECTCETVGSIMKRHGTHRNINDKTMFYECIIHKNSPYPGENGDLLLRRAIKILQH